MTFTYCPSCGHQTVVQDDYTNYHCDSCKWRYWNNPRGAVAVAFLRNDEVLVSKRGIEPNKGLYDLPGGFLEYAEDPYIGCLREIKEETGVEIQKSSLSLVEVYAAEYLPDVSVVDMVFMITDQADTIFLPADDSAALEWKPLSFLDSTKFIPTYTGLATILRDKQKK
jgi:ADP-ribose pyrophosphatase YjhB (NUDIX family)